MGGYDPKVIKNREKLHFFFRPPLFLLSLLGKTKGFHRKKRTAFLRTCRHFLTSISQFPAIFTLIFRKISVVFAQTMDFLEISDLRGKISPLHSLKTSPSLSLKTSPWSAHKNPLRMRCRGDYSSCLGTDALKDAQRHRSKRGGNSLKTRGIRSRRGNISTLLHRKISGTSISSACKRANRSSPSAVSEKRILRLSSLHICRLMSLSASAEAITLEALELVSPRASATSPAVCEERALRVQSSIASLRFKS